MTPSPEPVFDLAHRAIELALQCVSTGEVLVPFLITEGGSGKVITIMADSPDEALSIAQHNVDDFDERTSAFAFAYDGFVTMNSNRSDAIFVEASYGRLAHIHVFIQRYSPSDSGEPVTPIGNWTYLQEYEPRLKARG